MHHFFVLLISLFSFAAFGVSVEFKFDVNSSGPSIYPCNAGIRHLKYTDRICYDRLTQQSCTPVEDCRNDAECNCVCTGSTSGDGETRFDYLQVTSAAWSENGRPVGAQVSTNISAPDDKWNSVFNENSKEEWQNQLTKMSINLGSERYGAEYFLDICYRGPQIEYYHASQIDQSQRGDASPNFSLKVQATVNDLSTNGLNYAELADLQVSTTVVCDQQGKGNYIYAGSAIPTGATVYDQILHDIQGITVSGGQYTKTVNFRDFNSVNNAYLINEFINKNKFFTPRFCKVRYAFRENKRNGNSPLEQLRNWQLQKAEVCTFTEINESLEEI